MRERNDFFLLFSHLTLDSIYSYLFVALVLQYFGGFTSLCV